MLACVRVRRGVTIRGVIATADVSALEADAQVEPRLPGGEALLATIDVLRQLADPYVLGAMTA
jgi:hypothetical protein